MNEKGSRNSQLSRINEVSFAVDDMLLYLDTHPCDRKALEYCDELVKRKKETSPGICREVWASDY